MSKLFNQTRKAQDWASRGGAGKSLDLEAMLKNVRETVATAEEVSADLTQFRLEGCRKIRLPHSKNSKLIFSGNEFTTSLALESYRTLRTRLLRLRTSQGLSSIVISSAVAGEGKTLTSVNLALACAQLQDQRVLVIDADLRTGGLSKILGIAEAPGLSEILEGAVAFESAITATDMPNLYVLSAGSPNTPPPELFAANRWKEFLGWCSETFTMVLVDSPPILTLADFELLSAPCDGVLLVVRAMHAQRALLKKASEQVDAKKLLGVVYNGSAAGDRSQYQYSSNYSSMGTNGTARTEEAPLGKSV